MVWDAFSCRRTMKLQIVQGLQNAAENIVSSMNGLVYEKKNKLFNRIMLQLTLLVPGYRVHRTWTLSRTSGNRWQGTLIKWNTVWDCGCSSPGIVHLLGRHSGQPHANARVEYSTQRIFDFIKNNGGGTHYWMQFFVIYLVSYYIYSFTLAILVMKIVLTFELCMLR